MSPVLPTQGAAAYFPISEISTYQSKWTICARVTDKGPLRTFAARNGGKEGKVFHVSLLDATGGEIRASFFTDAADKFHDMLQVGKTFTFSKGNVRVANRQFNNLSHRYELIYDRPDHEVVESKDAVSEDNVKFNFIDLTEVQSRPLPGAFDMCVVITSADAPVNFTSQAGRQLVKREIIVADETSTSMQIVLWGDRATMKDSVFEGHPVVALKGVSVREWNGGRSGSLLQGGSMVFDPPQPEAKRLKTWWDEKGKSATLNTISRAGVPSGGSRAPTGTPVNMEQLREKCERVMEQPEVFSCICRLNTVQLRKQGEAQPLTYISCQEPKEGNGFPCNRRVDESGFCAPCGRAAGKTAPRLALRCRYADYSGSQWLTTFHEGAQRVVDMTAEEVRAKESDREALEQLMLSKYFMTPFQVTVRAKLDSYQGEARTNISAIDVRPISIAEHGRALLAEIKAMALA